MSNRVIWVGGGAIVAFVALIGISSNGPTTKPQDDGNDDHGPNAALLANDWQLLLAD